MTNNKSLRIGIVVGEASGDILGAGFVAALKKIYPNAQFEGIAGPKMQALGVHSLFPINELAVMGLFEVLPKLKKLLKIRQQLVEHFTANPPDIFVGIDAPDFNLGLEAKLKATGIKTVHYVSPSVWAWREKRIFKIAKATDLVLSLFPFEKAFYDKHKVPCTFVGHTLADQLPIVPDKAKARDILGVEQDELVLAILPGSRRGEIAKLAEPFLQTVKLLSEKYPNIQCLVPVINKQRKAQFEAVLAQVDKTLPVRVVYGHSTDVMTASDAILMASGTATLEAMLCKRPMVVAYKFNQLSYYLFKFLVRGIRFFSLPNLLADQALVPELLQHEVEPQALFEQIDAQLGSDNSELIRQFTEIHQTIRCNASETAAKAVAELALSE